MLNLRTAAATLGATALLAAPLTVLSAAPAQAAERDFRCGSAEVDFEVEKDDGRFEVDVDVDARRGTSWRIVLRHDGKVFHKRVHRADDDGDVADIDKDRRNTAGKDVFKITVKQIGAAKSCSRTIRLR